MQGRCYLTLEGGVFRGVCFFTPEQEVFFSHEIKRKLAYFLGHEKSLIFLKIPS
jgi:hypothetical protein